MTNDEAELTYLRSRVAQLEAMRMPEPTQVAQQKALLAVVTKIRESLDLESIFKSTATEVRQLLNADRVGMFRFDPESDCRRGEIVSEDVVSPYTSAIATKVEDDCFGERHATHYQQGRIWAAEDIYALNLLDCHIAILSRFQVRANLVVPLLKGNQLWGLLCIHQCSRPRQWRSDEIEFVHQIAIHLGVALQQAEFVAQLRMQSELLTKAVAQAVEREKAVAAIIDKIRRSLDINTIFQTTTQEARHLLNVDRVAIYRFNPDWSGEFVVESVAGGWKSLVQEQCQDPHLCQNISNCSIKSFANPQIIDTYLQQTEGGDFIKGEVFRVCRDIYTAGFSDCYIQSLERYQARAYTIIAIYKGKTLWGLLAAFQNSAPRSWQETDINFLVQIGAQLGVAIQQAELLGKAQRRSAELQTTLEAQLQQRADELAQEAERERALAQVIDKIRQTLDLDTIFQTAATEVRQLLDVERIAIYKFRENYFGDFIFESEAGDLPKLVGSAWEDPYLSEQKGGQLRDNEPCIADDIYRANLSDCHIEALVSFGIKSFAVVALFKGEKLWGLLSAFQHSQSRYWQEREVKLLMQVAAQLGVALQQSEYLELLQAQAVQQAKAAEQARALARVIESIRQTLDIDQIFSTTTQEVRQILNCDRVVVYRFNPDWSGDFVSESVALGWSPLVSSDLTTVWSDTCLQKTQGGRFRNHENVVVNDIYPIIYSTCHVKLLEVFHIKAYCLIPVFVGDKLWGLLGAYQNSSPRHWDAAEISLLTQVSNQLGVALQQAALMAQLKDAKEAADAANRAKSEFLANMSHELRTPLNAILGFAQVMTRDSTLTPTQQEYLGIIARSGEHLLTLLNDVLEMSKIEAGRITLNETSFDLYRLLKSLEEMLQLKAASKGLELIFNCDPDVPQYVRTDESKLRQVLINLLGNAIKFTGEGSVTLHVETCHGMSRHGMSRHGTSVNQCVGAGFTDNVTQETDNLTKPALLGERNINPQSPIPNPQSLITFEVEDTGPGIAPAELDTLFEAFIQTETGRKSQEGTGLGLPISQKFVQLMGGTIAVSSILSQGTTFQFTIKINPAQAADIEIQQSKRVISLAPNQPSYRILIADDKWESRVLLVNLIAPMGFEVQEAENGWQAVERWQSWEPHLIWMDMRMPVMDGYEATRRIRQSLQGQATVIIALTASVFDKQRSVVLSAGCDDFVSKPFREEVIFEKMAQHLGVRYLYAQAEPASVISPDTSPVTLQGTALQEALARMPTEWLAQLHKAALSAREKVMIQLIAQIPEEQISLAQTLSQWVNTLSFDRIVDLTHALIHE
ncbi:GAF domain-containing protein [Coleofasciculus sp.]|uniref:GAF domain-containing protein n=1 Tax=Coleofasciculus sp. TaxID=3100458 RepID=UPI0039FB7A6A